MKTCEATLCPECISATTTVSGSLSPTQTHTGGCQKNPKNNPTLNHRRAHTQSRWHAHAIGHKHPQLQSTVQHIIPFWCSQSAFPSSPVTLQWLFGSSLNMRKISRPSFFLVINSICCFMVLWEWQRQAIPHYKIKSKKKSNLLCNKLCKCLEPKVFSPARKYISLRGLWKSWTCACCCWLAVFTDVAWVQTHPANARWLWLLYEGGGDKQ